MNSSQISENPLPPDERRCPMCGEPISATATMCWLCLEEVSYAAGPGKNVIQESRVSADDTALLRRLGWICVVVVVVTAIAVMALEVPGILILTLVVAAPFMLWMLVSEGLRISCGAGGSTERAASTSFIATGCALVMGLAVFIAFFMMCVNNNINLR